jgi:hypothetical protein
VLPLRLLVVPEEHNWLAAIYMLEMMQLLLVEKKGIEKSKTFKLNLFTVYYGNVRTMRY